MVKVCLMLISVALAAAEEDKKTVEKRGLYGLGYGGEGLYGGELDHGKVAIAIQEKPVAVPVPVPKPYPVPVDRPYPVKVRRFFVKEWLLFFLKLNIFIMNVYLSIRH